MRLRIDRKWFSPTSTIGELYVNDEFQCYTLEDVERIEKVVGETAIPVGSYPVTITMSPRFKQMMPLVNDVKGFTGVRIHWGNTHDDTEGCILVGTTRGPDFIGHSREAYHALFTRLLDADQSGQQITLIIQDVME